MSTSSAGIALLFAFCLDRWFGEPPARWHPVVWMGRFLGRAGRHVAPAIAAPPLAAGRTFAAGTLAWLAGAALVLTAASALQWGLMRLPEFTAGLMLGAALKPLLAWRMLHEETAGVEQALAQSLDAGRERLSRLVSRDVCVLDETGVRESAIESLAENLNDSVVAPAFWFMLLGLPGAAVYRFANTADAMWGYRGERDGRVWDWAGKFAARADDVMSWVPARLTAGLLAVANGGLPATALRMEARRTPSPNSGWPMGAMALSLGVRLGKPGSYTLNAQARPPLAADGCRAHILATRAVLMMLAFALGVLLAPALWGTL